MAKDEKIYMPSGMGGLMRYSEEEKEVLKLQPKHVIAISIIIVFLELMMKYVPLIA